MKFVETCELCDVRKDDRGSIHKATCSDGPGKRIFNGWMNAARGHAGGPLYLLRRGCLAD